MHAHDALERLPEARGHLPHRYDRQAARRREEAVQRGAPAPGDLQAAAGREERRPLPSALRDRVRRGPRADPAMHPAGGRSVPGRRPDHQVRNARRQGVRRNRVAVRQQDECHHSREPRNRQLWRGCRTRLLVDGDSGRLLPHPDARPRPGPRALLQRTEGTGTVGTEAEMGLVRPAEYGRVQELRRLRERHLPR